MSAVRRAVHASSRPSPRPRLPGLCGGLLLLWTALGYGRFGGEGLTVLAGLAVVLAVALPRPLPGTSRAVIWSGVLAITLCLAVNLARVTPPLPGGERNLVGGFDAFPYDRIATVFLGLGLTALYFRPSRISVTVLAVAWMPAAMLAMERAGEKGGGWSAGPGFAWVGFGLLALTAQAQQHTRPRPAGVLAAQRSEWWFRAGIPLAILVVAAPLTPRIASAAGSGRDWVYGKLGRRLSGHPFRFRSGALSVLSPPLQFAGWVRPLLEIEAPRPPGYLREAVYHTYRSRQWYGRPPAPRASEPLAAGPAHPEGWLAYGVGPAGSAADPLTVWRLRYLRPRRLLSFCLPGSARVVLLPEGVVPTVSADGIVALAEDDVLSELQAGMAPAPGDPAYPWPDPGLQAEYRAIPEGLASAVSNWVVRCEGLAAAEDFAAARAAVVRHFHRHYRYALGRPPPSGEPLEAFMTAREGHCTLFASASALLLRARGIPTRVVGGFYSTERHRYTGLWVVRERDAHAWCEAWDAAAGRWERVEATPPGGVPGAYAPPGRLRLLWEALASVWRRLLDRLRTSSPLALLALALGTAFEAFWLGLTSPAGWISAAALMALLGLQLWRRKRRRDAGDARLCLRRQLVHAMETLQRRWTPPALRRRANEPWCDWWLRAEKALPRERAAWLRQRLDEYQALRYRPDLEPAAAREWIERALRRRAAGSQRRRRAWLLLTMTALLGAAREARAGALPRGVRWRGFNLTELTRLDGGATAFREEDFRQIAAWGFNFVRLPLSYEFWVEPSDWTRVREEKLAPIDEAVEWGRVHGLHVCLNFHRAPGYCINPPAEPRSLWTDAAARAACAAHWAVFARRYRTRSAEALSFNLLNEPPHGVSEAAYRAVIEELVRAIRAEDPDRPLIVDGLDVGTRPVLALLDSGLVQATRGYEPRALTHYRAPWAPGYDRPPVWPPAGSANAYLCGPRQPALHAPLVMQGPFPPGILRLRVGTVSDRALLRILLDETPALEEAFAAARGGGVAEPVYHPQWSIYRTRFDRDLELPLPAGTGVVRIEVADGDWLLLRAVEFQNVHGRRALLALAESWGLRQPPVQLAEMTLRPAVEPAEAWLRKRLLEPWRPAVEAGIPVFVGEWGAYNKTPHAVTLRWMEDCLRLWKEQGWGWALWNFRGDFGVLDSGRADVDYVPCNGHLLDARMLDLLRRY